MNVEVAPRHSEEYEPKQPVSYDKYRTLCDETQANIYRKTGVSDLEGYRTAQDDRRTVYVEIEGQKMPLFVPIDLAGGYNGEGCRKLTGSENVFALALPPQLIGDTTDLDLNLYLHELGRDTAIIIQTSSDQTQDVKNKLEKKLISETGWTVNDFIDPRCPEDHQIASIAVYSGHFDSFDESKLTSRDRSWKELFEDDQQESGDFNTEFITTGTIKENEKLFEQLWDLHDDKFDWLGQYHPVSMQESKDFFKQILHNEHTKSYVRFETDENGKRVAVCHGCFMDGIDQIEWLNDRFKKEVTDTAQANEESIQFFYGIVSKSNPDKVLHYAKDVMSLHSRLVQRRGGKIMLLFESTNMSSLYIPRIIQKYVEEEPKGVKMTEEVKVESQLDYWFLASNSRQMV